MIHSKIAIEFFRRIGFNNSKDPDNEIKDALELINDMEKDYFDYRIECNKKKDIEANEDVEIQEGG